MFNFSVVLVSSAIPFTNSCFMKGLPDKSVSKEIYIDIISIHNLYYFI